MFLPAVFLYFGIDPLHESVPLHEHVSEGGAGEDPNHLGAEGREVVQAPREDVVHNDLISGSHYLTLLQYIPFKEGNSMEQFDFGNYCRKT